MRTNSGTCPHIAIVLKQTPTSPPPTTATFSADKTSGKRING